MERKEAIEVIKKNWPDSNFTMLREALETLVPELKESEDERFKEELKEVLDECLNVRPQIVEEKQYMRIIAWLEKQGSLKDIVDRLKDSWYNEGKIAGMAEGLTDDEKYQQGWHDALEKQGEQKPIIDNKDAEKAAEKYRNFRSSCGIKDPVMLNEIEEAYYEGAIRKQKTVEWSEEDENNIINICAHVRDVLTDDALKKYRNWFKSLKYRYTWKPSEEQIECLCDAIKHYQTNGYPATKLNELYEQMSKIYKL